MRGGVVGLGGSWGGKLDVVGGIILWVHILGLLGGVICRVLLTVVFFLLLEGLIPCNDLRCTASFHVCFFRNGVLVWVFGVKGGGLVAFLLERWGFAGKGRRYTLVPSGVDYGVRKW